jgi:hypothetical protein
VPAFSLLRAASRFGIVVVFALSVLAGISVSALLTKLGTRPRPAAAAAIALAIAVIGELRVPLSFPSVPPVDPVYRVLAQLGRGPVLELPFYSTEFGFERTRYVLSSTSHWMPLVNGYSSYIPEDFLRNTETLGAFPNDDAFQLLERDRARYVVIHLDVLSADMKDDLAARLQRFDAHLARRYTDQRTWLYEITSFPANRRDAS